MISLLSGSLHFPPGSSPLVTRMAIYCGSSVEQACAPELPLSCYHGQLYLKNAKVLRGECYSKGIRLFITAGGYCLSINFIFQSW